MLALVLAVSHQLSSLTALLLMLVYAPYFYVQCLHSFELAIHVSFNHVILRSDTAMVKKCLRAACKRTL